MRGKYGDKKVDLRCELGYNILNVVPKFVAGLAMTEEEKQEKITGARKRLAKKAVIAGAVMSAAVPGMAAENSSVNKDAQAPRAVEQSVQAMPSSSFVVEKENLPAFGSTAWMEENLNNGDIKTDMSVYAKEALYQAATMSAESLQEDNKMFQRVMAKYKAPVQATGAEVMTNVGALNLNSFGEGVSSLDTKMRLPRDMVNNPHKAIDTDKITISTELAKEKRLGVYNPDYNTIKIAAPYLTLNVGDTLTNDMLAGSAIAQSLTVFHESAHKRHDEKVGLHNIMDTDADRLKKNRLTETVAYATECMAAAQLYQDFKKQGVTTLQDTRVDENGNKTVVEVPIERILDYYPGVKEVATQEGFDLGKPEDKRKVVAASSQCWHDKFVESYDNQAAGTLGISPTMAQQLDAVARDVERVPYDKQAKAMLKDIYIGGNHPLVDLSDCQDLLDTMTDERAAEIAKESGKSVSQGLLPRETLKKLDTYLTGLGIESTVEKSSFLETCYEEIVNRNNPNDEVNKAVKDILLENGGEITYADGMVESKLPNSTLSTIRDNDGKAYVLNADIDFARNIAQGKELENASTEEKAPSGLSVQQMQQFKNQRGM